MSKLLNFNIVIEPVLSEKGNIISDTYIIKLSKLNINPIQDTYDRIQLFYSRSHLQAIITNRSTQPILVKSRYPWVKSIARPAYYKFIGCTDQQETNYKIDNNQIVITNL